MGAVGKNLDSYSSKYENFILLGDFNVEPTEDAIEEFVKIYSLKNLVKGPTCFKNHDKPSCIDLILTNKSKSFQTSKIIKAGMSDFHKMVMTALKVYFKIKGSSVIQYCDYKNFSNSKFRNDVLNEMIRFKIEISRLDIFVNTVIKVLRENAPVKKRYARENEAPFMNKVLKKTIMKRSQLRDVFLKKKKKHLKVKLHIINKGATVPASCEKKNETILKTLTLQKFLTIRYSGKL